MIVHWFDIDTYQAKEVKNQRGYLLPLWISVGFVMDWFKDISQWEKGVQKKRFKNKECSILLNFSRSKESSYDRDIQTSK